MNNTTTTRKDTATDHQLDRRAVLGAAAGAAAVGLATHLSAPATAAQETKATFVLVHGAWAGAWIWRDVIAGLREAGHDVYATTATGMGDRVHLASPDLDLDLYITDVVNTIEFEDLHDVILVGWSFGGMIISGVAEQVPERLAQLVYFDASVPADGQSGYDAYALSAEHRAEMLAADIAAGVEAGMPGYVRIYAPIEEWIRAMTPDPAVQDWMFAHFTPQPLASWAQPIQMGNPDAAAIPHVFIYCTEGKGDAETDPDVRTAERVRADPAWQVVDLADTHLAPVNDPQAVVEVLLSLI